MCVIAICEQGLKLDNQTFRDCFSSNHHGAGFAWMQDGDLCWSKGYMDSKSAWKKYKTICEFPHIAHFRLSSAGGICEELTHPFLITDDSPIEMEGRGQNRLLFHNGTISGWQNMLMMISFSNKKCPEGKMSDTRVMAMAVSILGESMLDSSKYIIATPTEFTTYGNWEKSEGIYYSNLFFKRSTYRYETSSYGMYDEFDEGFYGAPNKKEKKKAPELPIQLRGQGKTPYVSYKKSEEYLKMDDEQIFADRALSAFYRRQMI